MTGLETNGVTSDRATASNHQAEQPASGSVTKTLIWVGIAGLSAALAFTVIRSLMNRQPVDPTSARIQQLIDEANQLLRTLDEQRTTS